MTVGSIVFGLFLGTVSPADSLPPALQESTRRQTDSLRVSKVPADSVGSQPDSITHFRMPRLVGSVFTQLENHRVLTADTLPWYDTRYLGDALSEFPGVYVRDQNSPGQYNQVNVQGVDWRGVAVLVDGRPFNDPASGVYNLFHFAPDYVERIEFISGTESFLYGANAGGATVNLVTKNFNSNVPKTKIIFSQSAYSGESSDASYSQNVSRRMNVSFGLRSQGSDGRFPNSPLVSWNVRGKVRFHLTETLSLIVSEYFTSTVTGLNGGVDLEASGIPFAYSPFGAVMVNTDSYYKLRRHDLGLTLVGNIWNDSTAVTALTVYYSNVLREYRDEENRSGSNGLFIQSDHRSSWFGGLLKQEFMPGAHRIVIGASAEQRQIEASPNLGSRRETAVAAWIKDRLPLGSLFAVSVYSRFDRSPGWSTLGTGGEVDITPSPGVTFFAGISRTTRLPNLFELYWSDSTVSRPSIPVPEQHLLLEAGTRLRAGWGDVSLSVFRRTVDSPILFEPYGSFVFPGLQIINGDRAIITGVDAKLSLKLWLLTLEGTGSYIFQQGESSKGRFPRFYGKGGLYFWQRLFNNHLELKVGFRGTGQVSQQGERFNPETLSYVRNPGTSLGTGAKVDFVLLGHIGDAYVHFVWENLTNAQYFGTAYYPVMDRIVRFGLAWEFLN